MEFSRQEHWSGLIFPSPGDLPDPGMKPSSPMCLALAGSFFTTKSPGKPNLKAAYCTPWRREVTCKRWCFTKKIWEVWKRKNPKNETHLKIPVGKAQLLQSVPYCCKICLIRSYGKIAAAAAKPLQSCPTLCDSIDSSPPGSPVPGILQARTLEWVAISFSNALW